MSQPKSAMDGCAAGMRGWSSVVDCRGGDFFRSSYPEMAFQDIQLLIATSLQDVLRRTHPDVGTIREWERKQRRAGVQWEALFSYGNS
jgi:hypothetical protein